MYFELSVANADKGVLTRDTIEARLKQFTPSVGRDVLLTRVALFSEKVIMWPSDRLEPKATWIRRRRGKGREGGGGFQGGARTFGQTLFLYSCLRLPIAVLALFLCSVDFLLTVVLCLFLRLLLLFLVFPLPPFFG